MSPVDQIDGLSRVSKGYSELMWLRSQDRTPDNVEKARQKITQLRALKEKHEFDQKALQNRGIELQTTIGDVIQDKPENFLEQLDQYKKDHNLSPIEIRIFKEVAKESLKKRKTVSAVQDRFLRQARKNLNRVNDDPVIDDDLRFEVGKLIFEAKTGKKPQGQVKWDYSELAIKIKVYSEEDGYLIDSDKVGGHFNNSAKIKMGRLDAANVPFIYLSAASDNRTLSHELGHAENAITDTALKRVNEKMQSVLWGRRDRDVPYLDNRTSFDVRNLLIRARKKGLSSGEIVSGIRKILENGVWDNALSKAKDEILADFGAQLSFAHKNNLLMYTFDPKGPKPNADKIRRKALERYQYLAKAGVDQDEFAKHGFQEEYDQIAQEFNAIITRNSDAVEKVWKVLNATPEGNALRKKLIAFLRQNPIEFWGQNVGLVFREDVERIQALLNDQEEKNERILAETKKIVDLRIRLNGIPGIKILEVKGSEIPDLVELKQDIEKLIKACDVTTKFIEKKIQEANVMEITSVVEAALPILTDRVQKIETFVKQQAEKMQVNHPINDFLAKYAELREVEENTEFNITRNKIITAVTNRVLDSLKEFTNNNSDREKIIRDLVSDLAYSQISREDLKATLSTQLDKLPRLVREKDTHIENIINELEKFTDIFVELSNLSRTSSRNYRSADDIRNLDSSILQRIEEQKRNKPFQGEIERLDNAYESLNKDERLILGNAQKVIDQMRTTKDDINEMIRTLQEKVEQRVAQAA